MPLRSGATRYRKPDPGNPEAAARCDRGGEIVRRSELVEEMVWAGDRLVPNGLLVCARHLDKPNPQDRALRMPPDPVPVPRPRPPIDMAAALAEDDQ
jgi:hypothetical protein